MEITPEDRKQGETSLAIIKKHFNTITLAMPGKQAEICRNPNLSARELINLRKQYTELQDTAHFLDSMYEAIDRTMNPEKYKPLIYTPTAPKNGMKIIN